MKRKDLVALRSALPAPTLVENLPFGEREALELIALAASELLDVPPFQDHPANQDQPIGDAETSSTRIRRLLQRQESSYKVDKAKSSWFGRLRRQSVDQLPARTLVDKDAKEGTQSDMDAIFQNFVPLGRLASIGEQSSFRCWQRFLPEC